MPLSLRAKSDKLRPDIIAGLLKQSATQALGLEPTENEVTTALTSMANAKAVGSDELRVKLLKLRLNHDLTVFGEFHRVIKLVWHQRRVSQGWRDAMTKVQQGLSQDRCDETQRLLRGEGAVRVLPALLDDAHDVHGAEPVRVGKESVRTAVPVFYRPAKGLQRCRPHTRLAGASPLRSTAANDRLYPLISRWHESLRAE